MPNIQYRMRVKGWGKIIYTIILMIISRMLKAFILSLHILTFGQLLFHKRNVHFKSQTSSGAAWPALRNHFSHSQSEHQQK
jgi:hypothetical protein